MSANNVVKELSESDKRIKLFHSFQLILNALKNINVDKIDLPVENKNNVKKAIEKCHYIDYLKLDDNINVLGLETNTNEKLSYLEQKAIQPYFQKEIKKLCQPLIDFEKSTTNGSNILIDLEEMDNEIIALENRRKEYFKQLAEIKVKKCKLMEECVELKFNTCQEKTLEILYMQYKTLQNKTGFTESIILKDIVSRTQHSSKAINEVIGFIENENDGNLTDYNL